MGKKKVFPRFYFVFLCKLVPQFGISFCLFEFEFLSEAQQKKNVDNNWKERQKSGGKRERKKEVDGNSLNYVFKH